MPAPASDEAFAREAQNLGILTPAQLEAARQLQTQQAQGGKKLSLGEALVQQGVLTVALRQNIEKRLGPKIIGPYQLLGKIGEGAMGAVYRAKVVKTGIEVALKLLPKKFSEDQSYIARFLREAKAGLELEHEHVVRTVDFGDHEGVYFIALELVQGGDLNKKLKALKLLPEPDALRVIHEVTLGLQHAHERGLVHRDIKPGNIMFTKDGKAKLSDFGLVKYTDPEASHLTQTGMAVGTPHYIAPEQATGEKDVDIRADIYSLGATLYHLVTGRPPYEGSSVGEVIMKHLTAQLTPPDEIVPGLSDGCVALIEKMMAKAREDRYATPAELLADLERVQRGELPTALIEVGRSSVAVSTQRMERLRLPKPVPVPEVRQLPQDPELRDRLGMVPEERPASRPPGRRRTGGPHAPVAGRPPTHPLPPAGEGRDERKRVRGEGAGTAGQASSGTRRYVVLGGVAAGLVILGLVAFFLTRGSQPDTSTPDTRVATAGGEYQTAMAAAYRELDGEKTADGYFYELSAEKRKRVEDALAKVLAAKPGDAAATELRAKLDMPKELALDLGGGIKMEFVLVPAGEFMMGDESIPDAKPVHRVRITKPFYMGKYEVTQAQYEKVTGSNPSQFKGPDLPVERVSWDNAQAFCKAARALTIRTVRLPTEAEWEYACRAGTVTEYNTGQGDSALKDAAWYSGNSRPKTQPVGQRKPNPWGLYDMHGSVWEWVEDIYGADYYNESPPADPKGPEVGTGNVLRGGGWKSARPECRSAFRSSYHGGTRTHDWGFRSALEPSYGAFSGGAGARPQTAYLKPETISWPLHDGKEPIADYAKRVGLAATETLDLGGGVKMEFVLVPAGEFMMGGPGERQAGWQGNSGPIHRVTITKPYYTGKYPVTVAQFAAFVNATKYQTDCEKGGNKGWTVKDGRWKGDVSGINWRNPGFEQTPDHPVVLMSWNDTQAFVAWASKQTGQNVRLPSEAQWEHAARGPKSLAYPFGETFDGMKVNHRDVALKSSGWQEGGCSNENDGYAYTSPVGKFSNASWCGALDMSGNVWQWVQDWEADYSGEAQADPQGPANGQRRVVRGGSWDREPVNCRSAYRECHPPVYLSTSYGFRVALDVPGGGAVGAVQPDTRTPKPETVAWPLHDGKEPIADYAKRVGLPPTETLDLGGGVKMEFVLVPAGEFMMGDERIAGAGPEHKVRITKPFYLGRYEVTQAQYETIMRNNPSKFKGPDLPVKQVSWDDAQAYCKKAGEVARPVVTRRDPADRATSRLPTEAEWEYACRAGTVTEYHTGQGEAALKEAGWYKGNADNKTQPVGQKKPNAWGLHDMHGNVWEWVEDRYDGHFYAASPLADPPGPTTGVSRVQRGGSWAHAPRRCCSADRFPRPPDLRFADIGFRVRLDVPGGGAAAQPQTADLKPQTLSWPLHDGKEPTADYAKRVGLPLTETLDLGGGVKMEFVLVPPGEFMMGDESIPDAKPVHKVRITKPFYLGKYEVTQAQYEKVIGLNPSKRKGTDLPVERVNKEDAQTFCTGTSKLAGRAVRLPTEAEWEYACRAATTTRFNTGDQDSDLEQAAWFIRNSGMHTNAVGQKRSNAWGLYDMHGNVWEWVQDCFGDSYYAQSPPVDPTGPDTGGSDLLRGGSWWHSDAGDCNSARRLRADRGNRVEDVGFRCVLEALAAAPPSGKGVTDAWIKSVQALPAEEQVKKVVEKLKELNPGWKGSAQQAISQGQVEWLSITHAGVRDISPVRALGDLQRLDLNHTNISHLAPLKTLRLLSLEIKGTRVADLSPLVGMPLQSLNIGQSLVADLAPLRGMKLQKLWLDGLPVADLSVLKGMPLGHLCIVGTKVVDLTALQGMALERLEINGSQVTDLRLLAGLPLKNLRCSFVPERDAAILRSIKTLERINDMPVAEFWKKYPEAGTERPWKPIFDGKTLECLGNKGGGAWRLDNDSIVNVAAQATAGSSGKFGDGEIRFRFETSGHGNLQFDVRFVDGKCRYVLWGGGAKDPLIGKVQELRFICRGDSVSATLNGQPLSLNGDEPAPLNGIFRFYVNGGTLHILSIEYRDLAPAQAP